MRDFRELRVWTKAHGPTLSVYRASASFPRSEVHALASQMRRSATSIPANIAEGSGRDTNPELGRFLRIALGSASELGYYLLLARDLECLTRPVYDTLAREVTDVKRMLTGFTRKLKAAEG